MTDVVVVLIIAAVLLGAAVYVVKQKKSGKKCIGCPYAGDCTKKGCECGMNKG